MKLLAQNIFGSISPPPGSPTELGSTIGKSINLFLIVAGIFMLAYLLWGGIDWIVSAGEKEKLQKAQSKITNAIIGMFMIIMALVIFNVVAGTILNIVTPGKGFEFKLPTF